MAVPGTARLSPRGWQSPSSTPSPGFSTAPSSQLQAHSLWLEPRPQRREEGRGWEVGPAASSGAGAPSHQPSAPCPAAQDSRPFSKAAAPASSPRRSHLSEEPACSQRGPSPGRQGAAVTSPPSPGPSLSESELQRRAGGSAGWSVVPSTERLQVPRPVRACMGGNRSKFLSPHLSKNQQNISSGHFLKRDRQTNMFAPAILPGICR